MEQSDFRLQPLKMWGKNKHFLLQVGFFMSFLSDENVNTDTPASIYILTTTELFLLFKIYFSTFHDKCNDYS